jgi:hypothetical protein
MGSVFAAMGAVFLDFDPAGIITAVFLSRIISIFTLVTRQNNDRADIFLFRSHISLVRQRLVARQPPLLFYQV